MIYKKNAEEIAKIREANRIVAEALDGLEEFVTPGVTTAEIDARIDRFIRDSGGIPAFLGYHGFPANSCISINEEVVHGIPSEKRALVDGDIVGIDIGVTLDGFFGVPRPGIRLREGVVRTGTKCRASRSAAGPRRCR